MKKRIQKIMISIPFLLLLLVLCAVAAARWGSVYIKGEDFLGGLLLREGYEKYSLILYQLRLPRVIGAAFAGAGLSLSGVLLQSVTGNDLAGPNIIGVNAGAGFAVILLLWLVPQAVAATPYVAFCGAFLSTVLILSVASGVNGSSSKVILAGIAVTAVLNAGISFIALLDSDVLASYNYFSVGGLSAVQMGRLKAPAVIIVICVLAAIFYGRQISILCLGDGMAVSLGVNVKFLRIFVLILASASAAAVVSYAGLLGFVGLVVPHISRKIWGSEVRRLIPRAALAGAILVILADCAGRILFAPSEIPVGIIMAFIGGPFFFGLLMRRKNSYDEI